MPKSKLLWRIASGVLGGGSAGSPTIVVTGNGVTIADGAPTPTEANFTHFFAIQTGGNLTRQFNLANGGTAALTGVNVSVSAGFSVSVPAAATINAGTNSNFTISCDTSAVAVRTGTVTISSNELANRTFAIKAYVFPAMAMTIWHKSTFWQDSAATTPAVSNGDVVGRADDWSGNSRHLSQSTTADKPTLDLVSEPVALMSFDGISDYLSRNESLISNANFTLFLAWRSGSATTAMCLFSEASTASGNPINNLFLNRLVAGDAGMAYRDDAGATVLDQNTTALSLNNNVIHQATMRRNGTNRNLRIDGVQRDNDTFTQGVTTATRIGLGAFLRAAISNYLNGKVAALIVCTSSLSDADRDVVEAALAEFY